MYHDFPRDARLWSFLYAIDQDLAETTRNGGCPCGGRLRLANYHWGLPDTQLSAACAWRESETRLPIIQPAKDSQ
jgi:hypothetical protein